MATNKNKNRKRSKAHTASRIPEIKAEAKEPRRQPLIILVSVVAVLFVAGILLFKLLNTKTDSIPQSDVIKTKSPDAEVLPVETDGKSILDSLSKLDVSHVEPQVANKIKQLTDETKKNIHSDAAWAKLAMNLHVHDFLGESVPCYKVAAGLNPKEFRWPYLCALALHQIGSEENLSWFERSRTLAPKNVPLLVNYGEALFEAGQIQEAFKNFKQASDLDPKSSHAFLNLARIAMNQGDLQHARTYLLKAMEINPTQGEVHGLLAETYRKSNETENAKREALIAERLPKKTPLHDPVAESLAAEGVSSVWYESRGRDYLQAGDYNSAASEFRKALQIYPDPRFHVLLGATLHYLGKYQQAAEENQAALNLNLNLAKAMQNLASDFFEMGKHNEAIAYAEKAKKLEPTSASSYLHLSTIYVRSGYTAKAVESLQEGLTQLPHEVSLLKRLAWLLATSRESNQRNGIKSVQLAEEACKITSNQDPEAVEVLAAAYAEKGDFQRAIEFSWRAYEIARSINRADIGKRLQAQLKFYQANQPYRE
jgi:tetratricopeptide (TPR) repeat protein